MPLYNYQCPNCKHEMKDILAKYETVIYCDVCKTATEKQIGGKFTIKGKGLTINNSELGKNCS